MNNLNNLIGLPWGFGPGEVEYVLTPYAFSDVLAHIKEGMTEKELSVILQCCLLENGGEKKSPVSVFVPSSYDEVEHIIDALKAAEVPAAEVHLTDIAEREDFRKFSYVSLYAEALFKGMGFEGYKRAIEHFAAKGI